ncbi:aldo/keto reductase [Candidatus Pseudothioglobus singularis]|nr:aldo/keto reductase [Candidatus Pseudothioglobus singularis]
MSSIDKLVIGGAQLGLASYGITNSKAELDRDEIKKIFDTANDFRIGYVDTARDYGLSEQVLGEMFESGKSEIKILTKLSSLDNFDEDCDQALLRQSVLKSIKTSKRLLNRPLDCLMLHRADHFWRWDGEVWKTLLSLQVEGSLNDLGVSVQTPLELEILLHDPKIKVFQLPFNILDWRWSYLVDKILAEKRKRHLLVHVRSSLLQGLLASDDLSLWARANCDDPAHHLDWLRATAYEMGRLSVVDLCLAYVRSQSWIDGVVIGMETEAQLHENIRLFNEKELTPLQLTKISGSLPTLSDKTLNPNNWKAV